MNRQNNINRLQSTNGQVGSLYGAVATQHDYFKRKYSTLQATSDPANIRVPYFKRPLIQIKENLASVTLGIRKVELKINEEISTDECTIHQDEERLNTSRTKYMHCMEMISCFEARIEECKEDERLASLNAEHNRKASKSAKRRAIAGGIIGAATGVGGLVAGVVLAPLTLGTSLVVSAAYGVAAGANISSAVINGVNASKCTDRAELHESTARDSRRDIQRQQEKCEQEEKEMKRLRSEIDSLKRRNKELIYVRDVAYKMLKFISELSRRLQEADDVLFDAIQETDAFELVQSLLASNPDSALAHTHLHELQSLLASNPDSALAHTHRHELQQKWDDVNNLFRRYL